MHIVIVAGAGLFGASYALHVTAFIMPSLAFIYWPDQTSTAQATQIRVTSLVGVFFGAVFFGHLADRLGRRRLYGLGLSIVLLGILGTVQASSGFSNNMSFLGWFLFWQFILGLGIGATYASTAILTAEYNTYYTRFVHLLTCAFRYAPTASRTRMMATVFLMHTWGQVIASVVGLVVLITYGKSRGLVGQNDHNKAASITDVMWRLIVGVGGIPILIGSFYNLTVPETVRYILDVRETKPKPRRALIPLVVNRYYEDLPPYSEKPRRSVETRMQDHWGEPLDDGRMWIPPANEAHLPAPSSPSEHQITERNLDQPDLWSDSRDSYEGPRHDRGVYQHDEEEEEEEEEEAENEEEPESDNPFSLHKIRQYFWVEGNWRYLAGIALPAFYLNTAFASLGTSDYRVLAQIWASHPPPSNSTFPAYSDGQSISGIPGTEIYNVLFATATRSLFTVSIASVVGSYLAIQTTDYFQRSRMLSIYSLILTMVLISIGSTIFAVSQTTLYRVTIVLYAVAQFIFSLGKSINHLWQDVHLEQLLIISTGPSVLLFIVCSSIL